MIREQFANFLAKLREADEKGLDLDVIVKAHEHENAYIYNDCVFKKIRAMVPRHRHAQPRGRFQHVLAGPRVRGIAKRVQIV